MKKARNFKWALILAGLCSAGIQLSVIAEQMDDAAKQQLSSTGAYQENVDRSFQTLLQDARSEGGGISKGKIEEEKMKADLKIGENTQSRTGTHSVHTSVAD